jgi:hypothetical protein
VVLELVSLLVSVLVCGGVVALVVYVRRAVATLEYIAWVVAGLEEVSPEGRSQGSGSGEVLVFRRE